MSAQYNNNESSTYESPLNSEQYTYYPTWFNGKQQQQTTVVPTPTIVNKPYNGEEIPMPKRRSMIGGQVEEDVVISGVSGRFPESDNVEELAQHLLNGERRWSSSSVVYDMEKKKLNKETRQQQQEVREEFDGQVFGLTPKQYENMDAELKSLVEVTYEAIFDSGLNPSELKGTRTGVFIGASVIIEKEEKKMNKKSIVDEEKKSLNNNNNNKKMLAQHLATLFEFKGPKQTLSTSCSSSLVALDAAINAIKLNECDYAIVAGLNHEEKRQIIKSFVNGGVEVVEDRRPFDLY